MSRVAFALFVACSLLSSPAIGAQQEPSPEGVRLDFQNVDLSLVISALAEAGNLNVVYGDLPQRSVTLRMGQPVPPEAVLDVLRSLASSNGLEVVEDGPLIRVLSGVEVEAEEAADEAEIQEPELRLFVHRLRHVRAPRIAATLQAIFGGSGTSGGGGPSATRPPSLSESLRSQQLAPTEPGAPAQPPVSVSVGPQNVDLPGQVQGAVQIVPDETTNSLIVRATAADWEIIEQAVQALDLRPLQVLIEVVIAEVRRTDDLRLGVSALAENARAAGADVDIELEGASAGGFILQIMRLGTPDLDAVFSALSSSGNVRIVSRPVILAQNNQQARILIGDERPFIQVFRSLPTDAAVRDQVVQYRDVGTSLTLTPTINVDGYVNLDMVQEVNTATAEEQFGAPIISTREAATQLFVRDGQTVVIGGLVDRQETQSESGVPLLKDIPLLGNLFKSSSREMTETELFLFVTPHIVASDDDADRIRQEIGDEAQILRPDTMNLSIGQDTTNLSVQPDTVGGGSGD